MIYDYINENKTKVLKDYWNNIYHVSIQDVKNKSDWIFLNDLNNFINLNNFSLV
jgi:hypothetical protein